MTAVVPTPAGNWINVATIAGIGIGASGKGDGTFALTATVNGSEWFVIGNNTYPDLASAQTELNSLLASGGFTKVNI